ncbi:MAG: MBL fold metallo-hydrolase [Methanomicrobiaceae archaeon]|nr:MBL fold metallo-hydrolase [Methanomicrobiaceae archaeon]
MPDAHSFIARMPNQPGALHRAAEIMKRYGGNISRIQYDRRIDPQTVFFEVRCPAPAYAAIEEELAAIGYLQTTLGNLSFLTFHVHLPHRPGALFAFLGYTTAANANIAFIDFDETGQHPDRVTVSLNLTESRVADELLNRLKSRYPLEILEYDTTGERLDTTIFYIQLAQKLRTIIGCAEEEFLLSFLHDINHIVQELCGLGKDPLEVFDNILQTGTTLKNTTGEGFYCDVQRIDIDAATTLYCFQMPGGGNIFLFDGADEQVMVDTGYGIYHADVLRMLQAMGLGDGSRITRIIITHADADHCGAGGLFAAPACMHRGTQEIIREANRAYGSASQDSILEEVYTTMINLFSRFSPPEAVELFPPAGSRMRSIFFVLDRISICGIDFEVLESLGGHLYGQVFLFSPGTGLMFTADSLFDFGSLTEARRRYNSHADFLITSVNVDSDRARKERKALAELAAVTKSSIPGSGGRCIVCGGHGAVSVMKEDGLAPAAECMRYTHATLL